MTAILRKEFYHQDAADAGTEGDKEYQCAKTRKPLHRRRSTRYPVDADQDITADAWEEKSKEYRSDEIHCGGGACFGARGVREIYAASPDGFQLGCDPAIRIRLYNRIETE